MKKSLFVATVSTLFFTISGLALAEDPLDSASIDLLYEKDETEEEDTWLNQEGKKSEEGDEDKLEEDKKRGGQKKKFHLNAGFRQVSGFVSSFKPFSQISAKATFHPTKNFSFSFNQKIRRNYFLNPRSRDHGFRLQDGIFTVETHFKDLFLGSGIRAGLSSSLPFSYDSSLKGLRTLSSAHLKWSMKLDRFLGFRSDSPFLIKAFVVPTARYYFSRWTTSPTSVSRETVEGLKEVSQSKGGTPLPRFLLGVHKLGLNFSFRDQFFLSGGYGRWLVFSHKIKYGGDPSSPFKGGHWQRHYYLFFLKGSAKIQNRWNLSLSYSLLDRLNKKGRIETVLFDNRLSSWSVSLSYGFSFDAITDDLLPFE